MPGPNLSNPFGLFIPLIFGFALPGFGIPILIIIYYKSYRPEREMRGEGFFVIGNSGVFYHSKKNIFKYFSWDEVVNIERGWHYHTDSDGHRHKRYENNVWCKLTNEKKNLDNIHILKFSRVEYNEVHSFNIFLLLVETFWQKAVSGEINVSLSSKSKGQISDKVCHYCGHKIDSSEIICSECGQDITK